MLKTILAISGKPGLYKLISQAKNMLIVEAVDNKKRMPIYASDKVISLGDIAMYTNDDEVPLATVLDSVKKKENGQVAALDYKKASVEELHAFMAEVLPEYDEEGVVCIIGCCGNIFTFGFSVFCSMHGVKGCMAYHYFLWLCLVGDTGFG